MKLPTLFKKTNTGAIQRWDIEVLHKMSGGLIVTRHGQVGGAIQETSDLVTEGKNLGKKNATTAYEQACAEAQSKHRKKIEREGYVESIDRARADETDQAGGIQPMLAQPWEKVQKKFKFPCDAQPKLDGLRSIAVISTGDVSLWSRKRAPILGVPHVIEAVKRLRLKDAVLDGELYTPGMGFQRIASLVRTEKEPKPGHEAVQYHIYDVPSSEAPWKQRRDVLVSLSFNDVVKWVEQETVHSFEEAKFHHDRWVADGYEGAILRSHHGLYEEGKRSAHLVKVKEFEDSEYRIVSVGEGRGKFSGLAMFTCVTEDGKTFECCAPGTLEDRRAYLGQAAEIVGQLLCVKFFGKTDDGLPRFPVGKGLRWSAD